MLYNRVTTVKGLFVLPYLCRMVYVGRIVWTVLIGQTPPNLYLENERWDTSYMRSELLIARI
jgi:hypothetical protein